MLWTEALLFSTTMAPALINTSEEAVGTMPPFQFAGSSHALLTAPVHIKSFASFITLSFPFCEISENAISVLLFFSVNSAFASSEWDGRKPLGPVVSQVLFDVLYVSTVPCPL